MATDLSSIRTMQDVINVLSVVYFNMNEIERIYYDMFINPEKLDVTFQRYNEEGVLETITLPNRAKMAFSILSGEGSPQGVVEADAGSFYLDTVAGNMYYKTAGPANNAYGWALFWNNANLQAGIDFLAPTGDGSQLTDLNASSFSSGVLPVIYGGTGATNITGLVKGNGTGAFTAAIEGVDYSTPSDLTGLIAYYPINNILPGWLMCDGTAYSRTLYAKLYSVIGTTYGAGDGSTTFNVPNLYNYYIRCWNGLADFNTVQPDQVGGHTHSLTNVSIGYSGAHHTHSRGSMNITGTFSGAQKNANENVCSGAFSQSSYYKHGNDSEYHAGHNVITFNAATSWIGNTSYADSSHNHSISGSADNNNPGAENRVRNKMLVPVIKY